MALNDPAKETGASLAANAPDAARQQRAQQLARTANRYGMFYPRWQLLAAIVFMPLAIVGYGIKLYFLSNRCGVSPLCSVDMLPGVVQVIVIWLLFLLVCFIISQTARRLETEPDDWLGDTAVSLKHLSNYLSVAPLLVAFAALGALELIATLWRNVLDPAAIALLGILILVASRALIRPRPPVRPRSEEVRRAGEIGRAATASYRLRTLPLVRRLVQPRAARQRGGAPNAPNAPNNVRTP
ncbi:MAG: hypothetical protein ACRDHP_15565 [Ktedonobacterales bacterium]